MPLKIPPLTPVPIQPTAAEPFSTFVKNLPPALTPLTGTELVPIIQNGASKHVPPNTVGFGPPVRTILTANTNYYVTVTGSDAANGSLATPWATLQHAFNFVSASIDIGGFFITFNIGAGTFAGAGMKPCVGSGNIIVSGAGTASTTINNGPDDQVYNFGEPISIALNPGPTGLFLADITLDGSVNTAARQAGCIFLTVAGLISTGRPDFTGAIKFIQNPGQYTVTVAPGTSTFQIASTTTTVSGNAKGFLEANSAGGLQIFPQDGLITFSGTPHFSDALVNLQNQGLSYWFAAIGGTSYTGLDVNLTDGASLVTDGGGFADFAGNGAIIDSSSAFDGKLGTNLTYPKFTTSLRTVLTANTNFYISTLGNDSNPGTLASPWATLQHAMNFIAEQIDIAGFAITVNVGTGSFTGVVLGQTVGGGEIYWSGNGHANSTITVTPGSGGNSNPCFTTGSAALIETAFFVSGFKIDSAAVNNPACISLGAVCTVNVGNLAATDVDIVFTNSTGVLSIAVVAIIGAVVVFFTPTLGTLTVTAPHGIQVALTGFATGQFQDFGVWTISGTPTINSAWIQLLDQSIYTGFASYSYAGVTGPRVLLSTGASCDTGSGGNPAFFPGNSFGTVDPSASYDGYPGPFPGIDTQTGASYTLVAGDGFEIVEMNNAGANTLTVPTNASVPFLIGTKIWVTQTGAGATTIAGAGGVTVDNAGAVGGQWKSVKLYKRGTNEWVQTNA